MKACPRLMAVQIPPSYNKTLPTSICKGVDLLEGDVWGHRKDIGDYYVVDEGAIEQIGELVTSDGSIDLVASQVQMRIKLESDPIKYIAKSKMTA